MAAHGEASSSTSACAPQRPRATLAGQERGIDVDRLPAGRGPVRRLHRRQTARQTLTFVMADDDDGNFGIPTPENTGVQRRKSPGYAQAIAVSG